MRYYGFSNYYLSQMAIGIQNAHCVVDIINEYYIQSNSQSKIVSEWSRNHKTMILLNGGNQQALFDLYAMFDHPLNPYPFGYFKEDEQSLNNALTCVGIILPEKIYEGAALLRDRRTIVGSIPGSIENPNNTKVLVPCGDSSCEYEYSEWEIVLMKKLNEYRLA
jgi:hypothetical protein